MTRALQLAVFDMAGTTIDDRYEVYRVLRDAVEREGARVDDATFQQWMGTEKRSAIENLLTLGGIEASEERVDDAFAWFLAELTRTYTENPPVPLPGVEDALATLRAQGLSVGLTTGFSRDIADLILERMGWGVGSAADGAMVDAVVCGDEVPEGRPAPFMIQQVMTQTSVTDSALVVSVGDTAVDVESARRAGVLAVGVLTGKLTRAELEAAGADEVLDGVRDLPQLLSLAEAPESR
ncbi:phosphonatase-like hydrolase [Brachybacterium sacelli]|uniref:Phosphonatase-like hydrolase n=1 Tax=Brachybacterium sacelli TaxID=173364 RepID=A0ABS4WVQ9_9MICO|nr:phosphonatase-like hydrolase [Brachybacterium sacelli]MBP2380290.1 phosphonatase-like hydrolase [Brachybacterium sacelli]